MSRVFSFRLDENNSREAQALRVIASWASRGFSLRYALVEALLALEDNTDRQNELAVSVEELIELIRNLQNQPRIEKPSNIQDMELPEPFLSAVAKATRPGIRVK